MMMRDVSTESSGRILTKEQLAARFGRNKRWVERQMNAGMPSIAPTDRYSGRLFRLADVEEWLQSGKAVPPVDRLSRMEARLERLERLLQPDGSAENDELGERRS